MVAFPTTLPNPSTGLRWRPANTVARSRMDTARIRQRQRFSTTFFTGTVTWELDAEEMAAFRTFFRDSVSHGADWFTMSVPLADGYEEKVVRFVGEYEYRAVGAFSWRVDATIETEMETGALATTVADEGFDFWTEDGEPVLAW